MFLLKVWILIVFYFEIACLVPAGSKIRCAWLDIIIFLDIQYLNHFGLQYLGMLNYDIIISIVWYTAEIWEKVHHSLQENKEN